MGFFCCCLFVCFLGGFLHLNMLMIKGSQLDFFWINLVLKCDKTGQPKKNFFFQNEYVGDFVRVIAGKEIIFLSFISSIESGLQKFVVYNIKFIMVWTKRDIFQEIFLPLWGLMTGEVSLNFFFNLNWSFSFSINASSASFGEVWIIE